MAGGDVELGRGMGQRLLREPSLDPLRTVSALLASGEVRFVNLESQLSEQNGQTISPQNRLVFTGPPCGAEVLSRAGIDVVSTANNHAYDYGKRALVETLANLDRAGVLHAGTGLDLAEARRPAVIERGGLKVAFLAVTDVWNQPPPVLDEARALVAPAEPEAVALAVRSAREEAGADFVVVSYHGGEEYVDEPRARARRHHRSAIDAGADVVIGHHPHVMQGVEWIDGRPVLHSLGNLMMAMHRDHPWTGMSFIARLRLERGKPPSLEACPYRIIGLEPRPFAGDPDADRLWASFSQHLRAISAGLGGVALGPPDERGCAALSPAPLARAAGGLHLRAMHQEPLTVSTPGRGLHDITAHVAAIVARSGVKTGLCVVFLQHTSASLVVQENADPAVLRDLERWLSELAPESRAWEHDAEGPDDMPAHARSAVTRASETIPVANGKLALGTWQALYLWEHRSRPHQRRLIVHVL